MAKIVKIIVGSPCVSAEVINAGGDFPFNVTLVLSDGRYVADVFCTGEENRSVGDEFPEPPAPEPAPAPAPVSLDPNHILF